MNHQTDILVIGGGAIGICCGYYLNKLGKRVMLVEKTDVCAGSSYGNAGLIVPSHSIPLAAPGSVSKGLKWMFDPESPFYIKLRCSRKLITWLWCFLRACSEQRMRKTIPILRDLHFASLQLFKELVGNEELDFGWTQKGVLEIFNTPAGFEKGKEEAHVLKEYGVEAQIIDTAEFQRLSPGIRTTAVGGIYFPQDGHLNPQRFVRQIAGHIEQNGVNVYAPAEVLGFETSGRKVTAVKTTRGDIEAAEIVVAGGSWTSEITRDLKFRLLIEPAKGYSITFKRPVECPAIPFSLAEASVVLTPMQDTLRFAGTLELAGLDLAINRRRVNAILKSVPQYIPHIDPQALELIEIWRGLRPCSPDGLPFLGRPPDYDNVIVATGHGMLGISLAPITGKIVSQLSENEKPSVDLRRLRIDRFD
jgi:D-amino-acid dehydrogenase